MLEFVRTNLRKWFTAILWATITALTIGGAFFGWLIGKSFNIDTGLQVIGAIVGGSLGLLTGIFATIICGGLVATFLKMDENIQNIAKNNDEIVNLLKKINSQNFNDKEAI
jgi:zinc transporter ZupT